MPQNSKPTKALRGHRTKSELELRKNAEKKLKTGAKMREAADVKNDPVAHATFKRLAKLYNAIEHNEAIFENVINRYCRLTAECADTSDKIRQMEELLAELAEHRGDMEFLDYMKAVTEIVRNINGADKLQQSKRKMLLDIEKECLMTIAGQLRAIPKKPQQEEDDPMADFLRRQGVV